MEQLPDGPGSPARNNETASSLVSPVSRVRYPSSSLYPPAGPRSAYTGTPAADSDSMSRYTVRTETSSSSASSGAVIRPRVWSSISNDNNLLARMPSF